MNIQNKTPHDIPSFQDDNVLIHTVKQFVNHLKKNWLSFVKAMQRQLQRWF